MKSGTWGNKQIEQANGKRNCKRGSSFRFFVYGRRGRRGERGCVSHQAIVLGWG
nr:MAG TPA: hypothetical protein [Caudoviricetes sp.]